MTSQPAAPGEEPLNLSPLPRSAEERAARIWEEVFDLPPGTVGADDSFFALGGDSLRGAELLARLEEAYGVTLALSDLFAAPTVAELTVRLAAAAPRGAGETQGGHGPGDSPGAIRERAAGVRSLPLSSPQRRLWFLDQLRPGNPAYNLAVTLRLTGELDRAALAAALEEVVRRHEALRTLFKVVNGEPAQLVVPPSAPGNASRILPVVDLAGLPDPSRAAAVCEREGACQPFDLARGPLFRASLARLAGRQHQLHVVLHHIVADGWSIGVLWREMVALYAAFARRQPSPLLPLPMQYGDFACWQQRRLAGDYLAARLASWRRRLAGCPLVLEIPADRPRPPVQSYRGAHWTHLLPAAFEGEQRRLAGAHGASLFMALLAGFQALLQRTTAQEDLIVGTAAANRERVELEALIGLFANTLPLRTDLSGDPPFAELLQRVRVTALAALAESDVPFELLVDEVQPQRDLSRPPIVQVMLVLQSSLLEVAPPPGLTLTAWEADNGTARFDLALSLVDTGKGLTSVWKYNRDLFDAATVERMADHFVRLLGSALETPGRRLSDLSLLAAAERQQIALEWNSTTVSYGTGAASLHALFEAQAQRTPEAVAVVGSGASLSYRELDLRADRLAAILRRLGVTPDVLVGVALERSLELVMALLAVLKAGGAYLPLDPSYPPERLAYMCENARLPILLTDERVQNRLPATQAAVLHLAAGPAHLASGSPVREGGPGSPPTGVLPENLAYVIFTSGSTGRPKGSMISHRGIVNRLLWMQDEYGLAPGESVLQKTPASFDVAAWELFWPLAVGARLVLARPDGHRESSYLAGLIAAERITTVHFVPSMLQVFLEEPRLQECGCLRRVIASGEALPRELAERFLALCGATGAELHNLYGPTEASVDVTAWACGRERDGAHGVPIGRPIANLCIHLLDPRGAPVPIGVPGHLHIGGVGLARGYLRQPERTAERFLPDPFAAAGGRLYATGDLARLRPDGAIEFLGRLDRQVKLHGFRIELGEIEAALGAHPAVRESVVVCVEGEGGARRLVAYVVGRDGAPPQEDELRSFLAVRLPAFMIPSALVTLPALPLTPSGKADIRALPPPPQEARPDAARTAPRTPTESRLAALWREQLGVDRIGVDDSFFALGGDSIRGALLVNRLQRELDTIVYVMALFDHPTVAGLAAHLEASYRPALVAAGWLATAETPDGAAEQGGDATTAMRELSAHLATRFSPATQEDAEPALRNRPAVFLLSPFRSGSTLLRVMLAGHPRLFAPPELELLGFTTMAERRRVFADRDRFAREGLLRAVMELKECDAESAATLVAAAEERGEPVRTFYCRLQEWAGDRILVDKTPRYSLDLPTLRRAESWFEEPRYIHLVRHPAASVASYLEARLDEVYQFPLPPRLQAELVWVRSHQNILQFLAAVPAARQVRVRFEDLVRNPTEVVSELCRFLGLDFQPAMLTPYEGERMTGGLYPEGRMMGDPKFHRYRQIEAAVGERWRRAPRPLGLGLATCRLGEQLGYQELEGSARRREGGEDEIPLSFAQQRLWFLDRLEPGASVYNMPAAVRLTGRLAREPLARACAELERRHEVLRTVFPNPGGRPRQEIRPPRLDLLSTVDLGALPAPAARAEEARLVGEEIERPFDLAQGPLWRVRLLRMGVGEHLLLVNLHHIVCDGWSVGVLTRELARLYEAFWQGASSPLPEPLLQYADFALWQRRYLAGEGLAELLGYWRRQLAPPLPVLALSTDRPRPAVQTYRGARLGLELAPPLVARLRDLGREAGSTLFMVLVAAFQILLRRYSWQDDLILGTPVANRNRAELEGLVGPLVNTLALRTRLSGDPTFRTLLDQVRQVCLGAARHQELPFERLVEELGVERALNQSPLFRVMLALQNTPPADLMLPALSVERLDVAPRIAKFDLTLDLAERRQGGLVGVLEYNVDLFDGVTIERLKGHFARLLASTVEAPDRRLAELSLLADAERHQIVVEWNATDLAAPTGSRLPGVECLHGLFEAQVERTPERVAVSDEGRRLTYRELDRRANRLAHVLQGLGVAPEVLVGVAVERSLEMVVALLAVLKAGGAYLPLDPSYPTDHLGLMLADAQPSILLTEELLRARLAAGRTRVLCVESGGKAGSAGADSAAAASRGEDTRPRTRVLPDNLAYTIYTSGSTGRPKASSISHRSIVNHLRWVERRLPVGPADVVVMKTPISFDASIWELFLPLASGARVALARPGGQRDIAYLAELVAESGATVLQVVPSMLGMLLDEPRTAACTSLRQIICGSEALPSQLCSRFLRSMQVELHNLYGPTECAIDATHWACAPLLSGRAATPVAPIGRPIDNVKVHLLDRWLQPVPVGVPGQLYIGGTGAARGYLGRPDLTAQRFVPDPMGGTGGRLYATGDSARLRPDGVIEFLGRLDDQVKIRGFRVELGDIEAALHAHPAVREAVVVARGEDGAGRRLVAYVVGRGSEPPRLDELRSFLAERLPAPMVPAAFVFLADLPHGPGEKIDRRSLPDPGPGRPDLAGSYVSPRNASQRLIAQVWQEVLGVEQVGIHDNFFDLGGHSLLAAEVHGRLRERLHADFPLITLFQHPTVHALAELLAGPPAARPDGVDLRDAGRQERTAARRRRQALARQRETIAGTPPPTPSSPVKPGVNR